MTSKPTRLRWQVLDRTSGAVLVEFSAPVDRRAAEAEARRLGFDPQRFTVRAVLDAAAYTPVKPQPDYAAHARARALARRNRSR